MTRWISFGVLAACMALVACGEKPQTVPSGKTKADSQAWRGSTYAAFVAGSWKAGDESSWEQQLRTRAQGQNEYVRMAPQ